MSKNYLEKLSEKEKLEVIRAINKEKCSMKADGVNSKVWNNALATVIDLLFGNK